MNKKATHYEDNFIDYKAILTVIGLLVIALAFLFFMAKFRVTTPGRGEMTDVSSYLKDAKKLTIVNNTTRTVAIEYSQFNNEYAYFVNNQIVQPKFTKSGDGAEVTMTLEGGLGRQYEGFGSAILMHGPSLEKLEIGSAVDMQYSGRSSTLEIVNKGGTFRSRYGGGYDFIKLVNESGTVDLDNVTLGHLDVKMTGRGTVYAEGVERLTAELPEECGSHTGIRMHRTLMIESVSGGSMTYNGAERPVEPIANACSALVIGR